MKLDYLEVKKVKDNVYILKIGAVESVQMSKQDLEILNVKIAAALNSHVIEDEQLKGIFERYESLQIGNSTLDIPYKNVIANVNSTKEKPLG